jgi:hypothetical protein
VDWQEIPLHSTVAFWPHRACEGGAFIILFRFVVELQIQEWFHLDTVKLHIAFLAH